MTEQAHSENSELVIPTQRGDEQRFEYGPGDVAYQRDCPDCEKGLLYAPVRWCPHCGGSGYLVRWAAE